MTLWNVATNMLRVCNTVFLIIDALDECSARERTGVFPLFKGFRDFGLDLHLLVTSRWESDIHREMAFNCLSTHSLSLVDEPQHVSVLELYISSVLSSGDYDEWQPHMKEKARRILESKADGM